MIPLHLSLEIVGVERVNMYDEVLRRPFAACYPPGANIVEEALRSDALEVEPMGARADVPRASLDSRRRRGTRRLLWGFVGGGGRPWFSSWYQYQWAHSTARQSQRIKGGDEDDDHGEREKRSEK